METVKKCFKCGADATTEQWIGDKFRIACYEHQFLPAD